MTLAAINKGLSVLRPPRLEWMPDGRLRVTRFYQVPAGMVKPGSYDSVLRPRGTPDNETMGEYTPGAELHFPDCVLVDAQVMESEGREQGMPFRLVEIFEEAADAPAVVDVSEISRETDGSARFSVTLVNKAASSYTAGVVGSTFYTHESVTGLLEREQVKKTAAIRTIVRTFLTQGILEARRRQWMRGMMWVEFVSVGAKLTPTACAGSALTDDVVGDHTGGAASLKLWEDIERVRGLPIHTVRVALKKDGSALTGNEDVLDTYTDWVPYRWPGRVSIDNDIGFLLEPPRDRMFHATVQICLTAQKMDKPEMVSSWASAYLTYTPVATGIGVTRSASYPGYLAGSGLAGLGTTEIFGNPARNVVGTVVSDPSYGAFTILGKVVSNDIVDEFTTSAGTSYRVRRIVTINNPQE